MCKRRFINIDILILIAIHTDSRSKSFCTAHYSCRFLLVSIAPWCDSAAVSVRQRCGCLSGKRIPAWSPVVKMVMWSRGLTWRSQVGATPIPIRNPNNLALFGHKITLYRFNQGAHTIARGSNRSRAAEPPGLLSKTTITGSWQYIEW